MLATLLEVADYLNALSDQANAYILCPDCATLSAVAI
jgi:hypothetical protein